MVRLTLDPNKLLENGGVRLNGMPMTSEEFFEFCRWNEGLRLERTSTGEIIVMAPSGSDTGQRSGELFFQLALWNRSSGEPGYVFDASAGFTLPNGAERAADATWIEKARYDALPAADRARFAHICPDFVGELMSPSDRIGDARDKMDEYMANGARLGFLIDRKNRRVYVYRQGQDVEVLNDPTGVSGDPELPGFTLDMTRIF
jgi:Uma2 family endonuclease